MADHTEVFKIAIYHFEAKMISRGTGRSVVAAAAYASCSKIYNDYDGMMHDYTRKHGCVYSEIFLPSNAPPEWQDRTELWNAVEAAEKSLEDTRLNLTTQLRGIYREALHLQDTYLRYKKHLTECDNSELLKKSLDSGQITLLEYLQERQFVHEMHEKILIAERDLALRKAELIF